MRYKSSSLRSPYRPVGLFADSNAIHRCDAMPRAGWGLHNTKYEVKPRAKEAKERQAELKASGQTKSFSHSSHISRPTIILSSISACQAHAAGQSGEIEIRLSLCLYCVASAPDVVLCQSPVPPCWSSCHCSS